MIDFDPLIAQRAQNIDASGIRRVFDLASKIQNPINLSIGQPHFPVPEPIKQAAANAIQADHNAYTQTQGIAPLREALTARFNAAHQTDNRWQSTACLITSGVSGGLLLALQALIQPGDEVLIPDPYFVMYKHLVTLAGGTPVFVDTYPDFQMTPDRVAPHITPHTKLLLLATPSNPTGVVTTPHTLQQLAQLCIDHNILLLSDEIYDEFCYEKTPAGRAPSPADYTDQILVLRGFSKTYAMTGWRLGQAFGPPALIEQMTKLQQYTFVCAPSIVQHAGLAALEVDMSPHVAEYQQKRDRVIDALSDNFELTIPHGAFYAFPKVPTDETATQFVERAIAQDVLIIPGSVFSEQDTHFRLSYATDSDTLQKGLDILNQLAKN